MGDIQKQNSPIVLSYGVQVLSLPQLRNIICLQKLFSPPYHRPGGIPQGSVLSPPSFSVGGGDRATAIRNRHWRSLVAAGMLPEQAQMVAVVTSSPGISLCRSSVE